MQSNHINSGYINESRISNLIGNAYQIARDAHYTGQDYCKELSSALLDLGIIQTFWRDNANGFPLRSERWSPDYINFRNMCSYPDSDKLSAIVGLGIKKKLEEEKIKIDRIIGAANTGIIIAKCVTDWGKIPSGWNRKIEQVRTIEQLEKEVEKDWYKDRHLLEGIYNPNDRVMVLDDVVSLGGTKKIVVRQAEIEIERREKKEKRKYDLEIKYVGVIIDREQGGEKELRKDDLCLIYLMKMSECLGFLKEKMHPYEHEMLMAFHRNDEEFQDPRLQKQLKEEALASSPFFEARKLV